MTATHVAPRRACPTWLRRTLFWAVLAQLTASLLLLGAVARLLSLLLPIPQATYLGRSLISLIYRGCWASARRLGLMEIDADCLDALATEPHGLILAANHPTLFDAMIVVAHVPQSVCWMRTDLLKNVLLGPGARLARYIGTDSARVLVRDSVAAVRGGQVLVVFPEGTRTTAGLAGTFKPGITSIAQRSGASIQTVLIHTDSPYLTKGWPLWKLPPGKILVTVRLGRRFLPTEAPARSLLALERYFVEAVRVP